MANHHKRVRKEPSIPPPLANKMSKRKRIRTKELSEYPGYFINEFGLLYSDRAKVPIPGRMKLKCWGLSTGGYWVYSLGLRGDQALGADGKRRMCITKYAHQLVYQMFCNDGKPIPEGMEVNHKDSDKTNNHYTNLELVTPAQNRQHAVDAGAYGHSIPPALMGDVYEYRKTHTLEQTAQRYCVSVKTIRKLLKRAGFDLSKHRKYSHVFTPEVMAEVRRLAPDHTVKEIAVMLKLKATSLESKMRQLKIKAKKPRWGKAYLPPDSSIGYI